MALRIRDFGLGVRDDAVNHVFVFEVNDEPDIPA